MLEGFYALLIILPIVVNDAGQYNEALNKSRDAAMIMSGTKHTIDKAVKQMGQFIEREADKADARNILIAASWAINTAIARSINVTFPVEPIKAIATVRINESSAVMEYTWSI